MLSYIVHFVTLLQPSGDELVSSAKICCYDEAVTKQVMDKKVFQTVC